MSASTQPAGTFKISANLPKDSEDILRRLAEERGVTLTEIFRHALRLAEFFAVETKKGAKILVKDPDGETRQVVLL